MPTNVNSAISPSIQPASRSAETKTDKIIVNKDGGSSSGFAKQTDVKFTNSVDNMSAVLEKISASSLGRDNTLPQQLRDMINNVVTKAFSLESSLGEGLGSAMASERYSVEQLTSLGRIFQQLGNMAEAGAMAGEAGGEAFAGELSDGMQAMMSNVKNVLAEMVLGGQTADLELVQLTKLAFQVLNNGNADNMPANLVKLLNALSGQNIDNGIAQEDQSSFWGESGQNVSNQPAGNANTAGLSNQQAEGLRKLVDLLFPKLASTGSTANAGQTAGQTAGQQSAQLQNSQNSNSTAQPAAGQADQLQNSQNSNSTAQPAAGQSNQLQNSQNGSTAQPVTGQSNQLQAAQNSNNSVQPAAGQTAQGSAQQAEAGQQAGNKAVPGQNASSGQAQNIQNDAQSGNGKTVQSQNAAGTQTAYASEAEATEARSPAAQNVPTDNAGKTQGGISPRVLRQAAEIENNPLFKQIFSRYGYSQDTGIVRQPNQTGQQKMPQLPNNQQVVDSFRNLADLLLKDNNLSAKDMALLRNFVNGSQTQLPEQDAKQLNLLLKMVQSNVPAAIQQAGQQQGMEGLPKLWAFLQLADLGSLKNLKARDLKNANKEIKTVVSSMKNSITSEGSYQADGQKSISFVMPLYIGEGGHSYPAYINLYDEPEHEDECGRKRKDTWFRVCVLTDNIGAVDIVCQLFEGNNLNLRINFSSQDVVQDFGEYLTDIRKALYDTSIHLNDLRVGTVN